MPRLIPRWRKATWALALWCALILIWAIAGAADNDCSKQATDLDTSACQAGTGIGVAIILLLGFFGFVFLAFIWLMSRPRKRQCPRCGEDVKKGKTVCPACQFDFASIGAAAPIPATSNLPDPPTP